MVEVRAETDNNKSKRRCVDEETGKESRPKVAPSLECFDGWLSATPCDWLSSQRGQPGRKRREDRSRQAAGYGLIDSTQYIYIYTTALDRSCWRAVSGQYIDLLTYVYVAGVGLIRVLQAMAQRTRSDDYLEAS